MTNKRILIALLVATTLNIACNRKLTPKDSCEGVACTMMFAMISVTVEDNNGKPVILDSFYTVRTSSGEQLRHANNSMSDNSYVILDDSYQKKLVNISDKFQFIGYKAGKQVVNEAYMISADCCHVKRNSGRERIVIP